MTSLATITSTGRTPARPSPRPRRGSRRASSTRSGSARLLPTLLPWASRNVFAMPPPRTSRSTFVSRWSRTLILSETLAPPTTAANGRSGCSMRPRQHLDLALHEQAGVGRQELRDRRPSRRGRGGPSRTRRSRRCRRRRRAGAANSGSFFSSSAWKRRFSSRSTSPGAQPLDGVLRADAERVAGDRHVAAEQLPTGARATGRSRRPSWTLPSGRPRWLARMTPRALGEQRADRRERRRGCAESSVTLPSSSGTLKSTRTKTRLPEASTSRMVSLSMRSPGSGAGRRAAGSRAAT